MLQAKTGFKFPKLDLTPLSNFPCHDCRSCDNSHECAHILLKFDTFMLACTVFNEQNKMSNRLIIVTWSSFRKAKHVISTNPPPLPVMVSVPLGAFDHCRKIAIQTDLFSYMYAINLRMSRILHSFGIILD